MSDILFQRYQLEKKLGQGTLGEVYLAFDQETQRQVAVKLLRASFDLEKALPYLQNEFQLLSSLRHPNLVRVFHFHHSPTQSLISGEYIEGREFDVALRDKNWRQVLDVYVQLCRVLDYIHSRGILHGDLKPENILIVESPTLQLKLLDFGLAQKWRERPASGGGTAAFQAPELQWSPPSPRSDLYAAAVLFEERLRRHHAPRDILEVLERSRHADPQQRFSRANHGIRALNRWLSEPFEEETRGSRESHLFSSELIGRSEPLLRLKEAFERGRENFFYVEGSFGAGKSRLIQELKNRIQLQGCPVIEVSTLATLEKKILGQAVVHVLVENWRAEDIERLAELVAAESSRDRRWIFEGNFCAESAESWENFKRRYEGVSVTLASWEKKECEAYLRHITGKEKIETPWLDALFEYSGGRPALLIELLRENLELFDRGQIPDDWDAVFRIPLSVEGTLAREFERLSTEAQHILGVLAVSKYPLSRKNWTSYFEVESHVETLLQTLLRDEWIRLDDDALSLHNGLSKKWIEAHLDSSFKKELHLKFADDLKCAEGKLDEITYHLAQAGLKNEAHEYALKTAEFFEESGAKTRAFRFYCQALAWATADFFDEKIFLKVVQLAEQLGDFDGASWYLQKLLSYFEKRDIEAFVSNSIRLAAIRQKRGELQVAEAGLVGLFEKPLNPPQKSQVLSVLIRILLQSGRKQEAERWVESQFLLAERSDLGAATFLDAAALVAFENGDAEKAEARYRKCLVIYQGLKHPRGAAHTHNNLGMVIQSLNRYDESQRHYETALELALTMDDLALQASISGNLGSLCRRRGNGASALKHYREAERIHHALGMDGESLHDWVNLAQLFSYWGAHQEAESYLRRIQEFPLLQKRHSAYYHAIRGDLALLGANYEEASYHYQSAVQLFVQAGYSNCEGEIRFKQIHLAMLNRAFDEALRLSQRFEAPNFWKAMARSHLEEPPQAREILLRALELIPPGEIDGAAAVHARLFQINQDLHETRSAQKHLCAAYDLLQGLCERLPEEFQKDFWRVPDRREVAEAQKANCPMEEERLHASRYKLDELKGIHRRLQPSVNLDKLLRLILDSALAFTGAQRGYLLLKTEKNAGGDFGDTRLARREDGSEIENPQWTFSEGLLQKVLEEKKVLLCDDAKSEVRFSRYQSVHKLGLSSVLIVPLLEEESVVGLLALDHPGTTAVFGEQDIPLVEMFAEFTTSALKRHREFKSGEEKRGRENRALKTKLKEQAQTLSDLREALKGQRQHHAYPDIVGQSAPMQRIFQLLDKIKDSNLPVMIFGESGTGKELIARALHFHSRRKKAKFVSENCSAIPEHLLESELFGHEKGAFTGADRAKSGLFQHAHHGTLFLDEIGDLPLKLQPKLLRVLQEKSFRPLGARETVAVDARIVAATHCDLTQLVEKGGFRADLFYRLNGVQIQLPPLRERREDIPLLLRHFLEKYAAGQKPAMIHPEALNVLTQYNWPGNIRELYHTVHNALLFSDGGEIYVENLSFKKELFDSGTRTRGEFCEEPLAATQSLLQIKDEKQRIIRALELTKNHKSHAALLLGMSRKTLYNKIMGYQIEEYSKFSYH